MKDDFKYSVYMYEDGGGGGRLQSLFLQFFLSLFLFALLKICKNNQENVLEGAKQRNILV
jgi:hypothetical protein